MGSKASKIVADEVVDALHIKDDDKAIALIIKHKIGLSSLQSKSDQGRVPYIEACKTGRRKVVKHILEMHDAPKPKAKLSAVMLSGGLLDNCANNTDRGVVRFLLERGAVVEVRDKDGNTPLIQTARKGGMYPATPELLAHRREAATMLILKGAEFKTQNRDHKNALIVAIENYNEQLAHVLLARGADLADVDKWASESKNNSENWVVGSCRAKFLWDEGTAHGRAFIAQLKEKFLKEFDKDGSGYLDEEELLQLIASHLKVQGAKQKGSGLEGLDCSNLDIPEIVLKLQTHYKSFIKKYIKQDTNGDGKYDWAELLPIVARFFSDLWTRNRPDDEDSKVFQFPNTVDEECADFIKGPLVDIPDHIKAKAAAINEKKRNSRIAPEPLPEGWDAIIDEGKQREYFVHKVTTVTQWQRPTGAPTKEQIEKVETKRKEVEEAAVEAAVEAAKSAQKQLEGPLPDGWQAILDPITNREYYCHTESKKTRWERPTLLV